MQETNKITHLQMIQEIITRMGRNSFQLKGWAVGIMIAIFSFAGNQSNLKCILFTVFPLIVIWFLDSYYLLLERKFRLLYDNIRIKDDKNIDFDMNYNSVKLQIGEHYKISFLRVVISRTEILFYLTCIITTILIYIFA